MSLLEVSVPPAFIPHWWTLSEFSAQLALVAALLSTRLGFLEQRELVPAAKSVGCGVQQACLVLSGKFSLSAGGSSGHRERASDCRVRQLLNPGFVTLYFGDLKRALRLSKAPFASI